MLVTVANINSLRPREQYAKVNLIRKLSLLTLFYVQTNIHTELIVISMDFSGLRKSERADGCDFCRCTVQLGWVNSASTLKANGEIFIKNLIC